MRLKKLGFAIGLFFVMLFGQNCSQGFRMANLELSSSADSALNLSLDGAALYATNCAFCHQPLESSSKKGRSAVQIGEALRAIPNMNVIQLSEAQIAAVAAALDPANIAKPALPVVATCAPDALRGLAKHGVRRLTRDEIKNSIQSLGLPNVYKFESIMDDYPEITEMDEVTEFEQLYSEKQAWSFSQYVDAMAEYYGINSGERYFGGNCFKESTITETCWNDFFKNFGRKVYRRPLEAAEISRYTNAVKSLPAAEGVYKAFHVLLRSPDFLFHLESGSAADGTRVRLTDHEVANRIAYALTGSPPDETLSKAADLGQLKTMAQVEAQTRRLLDTDKAHKKLEAFYGEWLQFSHIAQPNTLYQDWIQDLGLSDNMDKQYRQEIIDYMNYVIWNEKGTFKDLMTRTIAFPKSYGIWYGKVGEGKRYSAMSGIYGTDKFSGFALNEASGLTAYPAPNHPGLLYRAGLLANAQFATSPIRRGVYVKRRIFCDDMPTPDFSVITQRLDEVGVLDPHKLANHQITTQKTSAAACIGCHSQINPIGFAFEAYDPLGKPRTVEKAFYEDNLYKAPTEHALPGPIAGVNLGGQVMTISTSQQMSDAVASSPKAQVCMAKFMLRHFERRIENVNDGCALADAVKPIDENKPVLEMFVNSVANEDIFWRKQ